MSQVDYGLAPTTKLSTKSVATPLARVKVFFVFFGDIHRDHTDRLQKELIWSKYNQFY